MWDWDGLKTEIEKWGIRNSLLFAPMPTASTSQILGNNECIEPYTSNIYLRRTIAGEFTVINKHLLQKLIDLNLGMKILKIKSLKMMVVFRVLMKYLMKSKKCLKRWGDFTKKSDRYVCGKSSFVCQSQSLNHVYVRTIIHSLSSMHFYSWRRGLKIPVFIISRNQPKAKNTKVYESLLSAFSCSG